VGVDACRAICAGLCVDLTGVPLDTCGVEGFVFRGCTWACAAARARCIRVNSSMWP